MEQLLTQISALKDKAQGYWGIRIISQVEYAVELSKTLAGRHLKTIEKAVELLTGHFHLEGVITKAAAQEAEGVLSALAEDAKSFQMLCVAHAHIDMNWMWRYDETVAVTLDTFRTMLDLMREYEGFTFSQSQASVYRIVEEHHPSMLEEIKERILEGRWEVTASTWVETDKNMPTGESLARHILYTKRSLSRMLDIDPEKLNLDFEPDTFGHSQNVPEILAQGGVKYYYHCRGYDGYNIYRWKAPSRSSVIVYREPLWYNAAVEPSMAAYVPGFCTKHGMNTMLKVYGVGNHGGGPTRRDIERIIDMASWPVFPSIRFGTYGEFFSLVEAVADQLPVVNGELNYVFTGCYTTQTRIKAGNSILEARLKEAEAFAAAAAISGDFSYPGERFASAWEMVLFNQFHDILPGSGTVDTREYSMGLYQQASAIANTQESLAIGSIADRIDTSDIAEEDALDTTSEGAGVGYGLEAFELPQTERGRGLTRIFHLFNASTCARKGLVEITLWDWAGDLKRLQITDPEGQVLPHQVTESNNTHYWGHQYYKLLVKATLPSMGYTTCILKQKPAEELILAYPKDPRVERSLEYILENEHLKVVFDKRTAAILSFVDKSSGQDIVGVGHSTGIFRFIEEDESQGMTAWVVGRYRRISDINSSAIDFKWIHNEPKILRQSLCYEAVFGVSKLKVVVSLDQRARALHYETSCDFRELGGPGKGIPQLQFYMPVGYECRAYKYDIPSGTIEREAVDMDVPAISFASAVPKDPGKKPLTIISHTKHGFRGFENALSLTLIRASFDPDPYPEVGLHTFQFSIGLPDVTSNRELIEAANSFRHPIRVISARPHKGELLKSGSFMAVEEGSVAVQAIKMPEDGRSGSEILVRMYETEGRRTKANLSFCRSVAKAMYVDINENAITTDLALSVSDNHIYFSVEPFNLVTLKITFRAS